MAKAVNIPNTDTAAIDFKAGCLAKIIVPIAKKVVIEANNTDVLYTGNSFLPLVYCRCKAQVRKILKSTEWPNTRVQTIILNTLNSMPNKYIKAEVTTPVTAMGTKAMRASSIRLKNSSNIRKIATDE